ncbi:MAG: helix-turn-helix transcriptional regulator [Candidatus Babeliales bacterium]
MNRVREIREALGMSRASLAAQAGVSPSTIAFIETGYTKRTYPRNMKAISEVLGCAVSDAFPGARVKLSIEAEAAEILANSDRLAPGSCDWCGRRNVKAQMVQIMASGEPVHEFGHLRCAAEYIIDNTDRHGNWKKPRIGGV